MATMLVSFWGWTQVLVWLLVSEFEPPNWAEANVAWSAPHSCPNEEQFRAQVFRAVEEKPLLAVLPFPQDIVARIEENKSGKGQPWQIHLILGWEEDLVFRTLQADRCDALVEAAALIILIAAEQRMDATPMSRATPRRIVDHLQHDLIGTVGIEGFESFEQEYWTTPVNIDYRFGRKTWRIQTGLRYSSNAFGRTLQRGREPGAWIRIFAARPGACYRQGLSRRFIGVACTGAEIGWLGAQGVHVSKIAKVNRLWVAAWFAGSVDIQIRSAFSLVFRIEGAMPIMRLGLEVGGVGEVYRIPAFALRPSLGFRWQFK